MKRPPSVVTAIVVLSLFALVDLYLVYAMYSSAAYARLPGYLALLFALATPVYGLLSRQSWSRIYSVVLLVLFAALVLIGNGAIAVKQHAPIALIYALLIAGLLAWLVISLLSREVKGYFAPQDT